VGPLEMVDRLAGRFVWRWSVGGFCLEVKDYSRLMPNAFANIMPNGTFLLKSHIPDNQYHGPIGGGRALKSSLIGLKHYITV